MARAEWRLTLKDHLLSLVERQVLVRVPQGCAPAGRSLLGARPAENSGADCASLSQVTEGPRRRRASTRQHTLFHGEGTGPADRAASLWPWLRGWRYFDCWQPRDEAHTFFKSSRFPVFIKKAGNAEPLSVPGVAPPKAEGAFIGAHSAYGICAWPG